MEQGGTVAVDRTEDPAAAGIASAYRMLAAVLEAVDVEENPSVASELITALSATDRAYALETDRLEDCPPRVPQSSAGD